MCPETAGLASGSRRPVDSDPDSEAYRFLLGGRLLTYPRCPACGAVKRGLPLLAAETAYPFAVAHNHGACPVSRYIVTVHPDGSARPESVIPRGASMEEHLLRV